MIRNWVHTLAFAGSVLVGLPCAVQAETLGSAIMQNGGANPQALPCMTCHGADGKGMANAGFPRLAGLPKDYIVKQLNDFRSGQRINLVMQPIAQSLTPDEIQAVATSYSRLPKVNVVAQNNTQPKEGTGEWIAQRGIWSKNVPECIACHGPSGVGVGSHFPPLAGQSPLYIESQLYAWKGKRVVGNNKKTLTEKPTRFNDPNGLMGHIAVALSDSEIKAVAEYFGSLGDSSESFDESQHRPR
jgi:cytochrome c553